MQFGFLMEDSVTFATNFQQNYANVREKGYFQGVIHKNRIDKKNFSLTKKIEKIKIDNARTKKVFYTLFIRPPFLSFSMLKISSTTK